MGVCVYDTARMCLHSVVHLSQRSPGINSVFLILSVFMGMLQVLAYTLSACVHEYMHVVKSLCVVHVFVCASVCVCVLVCVCVCACMYV